MFPFRANRTHFLGLRKRTNGCCRKKRQIESLGLVSAALRKRTSAPRHCRIDALEALLNSRVVNSRRRAAVLVVSPALLENVFNFLCSSVRWKDKCVDSCQFLLGARQPDFDCLAKIVLDA